MSFTSHLLGFLRRAGTERSTARVIAEVFQFVGEAFTFARVSLHLADRDTGRLIPFVSQFASGEEDPELFERWRRFDIEDTDLVRRVRGGEDAVLVEDPVVQGALPDDFVGMFDVGPFLAVALRPRDRLDGLLIIEGPADVLRRRRNEAVEFADYLALALDNASAFEREQERAAEAQALLEVADVLAETTDLVPVLAAVTRQCAKVTGFERCSVFLIDADDRTLVPTMSQFADGHPDPEAWHRFRNTEADLPVAWEVIESGEAAAFEHPEDHPDRIPAVWLEPFGIETIVYLPLTAWGQRFGVIELDHRERTPITDRQLRIAHAVAAQGAVAIGVTRALSRERAAVAELERANRAKDDFLSMVSHEMRTPLTSIRGFADVLDKRGEDLDDDQRRHVTRRILVNVDRQIELIDDLLDSERLSTGTVSPEPQEVRLRSFVADVVEDIGLEDVSVEISQDHTTVVDPIHLRRILTNLLINADRYGRPPFAVVGDDGSGTMTVRVRDHGQGVPEPFIPRLFDRFAQAEGGEGPGVGLGLSIARDMARANGGDLRYEDGGPGACFVLTLPSSP